MKPKRAPIGLLTQRGCAMVDTLVAIGGLPLSAVDVTALSLPQYTCPYGLPSITGGETLLLVSSWLKSLRDQGFRPVEQVLEPLRKRFDRIIGLDHADPFLLDFAEPEIEQLDAVLKVHGVFRDPDLYNYVVGSVTPDGRWTEKVEPLPTVRSAETLRKLQLSIPCFLAMAPLVRKCTRPFYTQSAARRRMFEWGDALQDRCVRPASKRRPPRLTAHFYASLTHGQRATAARMLRRSSLPWTGGITSVPRWIQGLDGTGITGLSPAAHDELIGRLRAEELMAPKLNRFRYQTSMWEAKVVLSITGFGELCFRQAEAWANRRLLVCQDLSHVKTLFPLEPGRNVIYCRPDLSDLVELLEDIECNYHRYASIAEQGYADWREWSGRARDVLTAGYQPLYPAA